MEAATLAAAAAVGLERNTVHAMSDERDLDDVERREAGGVFRTSTNPTNRVRASGRSFKL
jgi:hypothetical protein